MDAATKQQATEALAVLTTEFVMSVYSGKPGCCCGCNGNHRYNSKHVALGSASRGYAVTPADVNDRQVAKVLALVQANADRLEDWDEDSNNFAVTLTSDSGTQRLYIVYPTRVFLAAMNMAARHDAKIAEQNDAYLELAAR